MNIYIDIGGTNFRYFVFSSINNIKCKSKCLSVDKENVFHQLDTNLKHISNEFKIKNITVCLPGIIKNSCIYGVNNLNIVDGAPLLKSFEDINIKYVNDGDAFVIGETMDKLLTPKNRNIIGIIFGTGVGCGLILNGRTVWNSEIHMIFETYMKKNYLTNENVEKVTDFIALELNKLISLLTLNYIIIGGYVSFIDNFEILLHQKMKDKSYYNTTIIVSKSRNSILRGLQLFSYMNESESE
jgi:hypothetical protein